MANTRKIRALILAGTILGVCAVALVACAEDESQPGLPRGWSRTEIAKEMPPYGADGKVYVLAWKIVEDERPLRVESCLVLKVLPDESEEGRWCLAQLYRHPNSKKPEWQLSSTHYSGGEPGTKYFPGLDILHVERFKNKPSNKTIYAALGFEQANWKFELEKDWKLVGCGVCEDAWQAALGEKPTKFFGPEKK
jgi:hypothetical protein